MVWDDNGLDCQKYYFYKVNDKYCIRAKHCSNDRVIDINAVSLNAQLYDLNLTNPNQQFMIVKEENDDNSDSSMDDSSTDDTPKENGLILTEDTSYIYENDTISKVKIDTLVSDFTSNFTNTVIVKDADGNVVESTKKIGTGFTVTDETNSETATIIILGDVNGDGGLTATDYLQIKLYFYNNFDLDGVYKISADVDSTNVINSTDYMKVKSHFLNKINIYE